MSINVAATAPSIARRAARVIETNLACTAAHCQRMKHHPASALMSVGA